MTGRNEESARMTCSVSSEKSLNDMVVAVGRNEAPLFRVILGTVQLHHLIEAGKGDSPEADAVRDEMDEPFRQLTAVEYELCRLVSAAIQDRAWIPVAERLPKRSCYVIGICNGRQAMECTYIDGEFRRHGDRRNVTHWQHFPEPPTDCK